MNNLHYKKKYLKYKSKYLKLKGGMDSDDEKKCDCVCPLEKKNDTNKCEEREYITVTITQLNGEEFHLTIPQNSTTEYLYNRIEIQLSSSVDLYIKETPVCHNGTLDDYGIIHGSELSCIIKETNYLIDAEKAKKYLENIYDDVKVIFIERSNMPGKIIPVCLILFEEDGEYISIEEINYKIEPELAIIDILQNYFSTSHSAIGQGLFHPSSIINDDIILQAIHEGFEIVDHLVTKEDKEYMKIRDFMTEFYNTCCQPYDENLTKDDLLKNIIYDDNPSEPDDDDY